MTAQSRHYTMEKRFMNTGDVALAIDLLSRLEQAALARLMKHAQGDTGQSRKVADFLLA